MGQSRTALPLPRARWRAGADGPVCRAQPTAGLSLHVRRRLERGLPGVFVPGRSFRRCQPAPAHHDVSLVAVSRAPYGQFRDFRRRMGWRFPWFSSHGGSFNEDFGVSVATDGSGQYNYEAYAGSEQELPGLSAFYRDGNGAVYHTYSTYARGWTFWWGLITFSTLRRWGGMRGTMDWVRHHDRYEVGARAGQCCHE